MTVDRLDPTASNLQAGTQNKLTAITYAVAIPSGGSSHVTIDLRLPPRPKGPENFVVVPGPRIYRTITTVNVSG